MQSPAQQLHAVRVELSAEEMRILDALARCRGESAGDLVREALGFSLSPAEPERRGVAGEARGLTERPAPWRRPTLAAAQAARSAGGQAPAAATRAPAGRRARLARALERAARRLGSPTAPAGEDRPGDGVRGR